jgi:hypothetical protein
MHKNWRVLWCCLTWGCASLESVSSGQIGCREEDIEISDDSPGWNSRTWTAKCNKRTYYCTSVSTGNHSSQVNCKEDNGSASAAAAAPAPRPKPAAPAPAASPTEPSVAAPSGAVGLVFGSDIATATATCQGAGLEWSDAGEDQFACSGLPKPVGVDARTISRFCQGRLCALRLRVAANGNWAKTYVKLTSKLREKYGEPQARGGSLPHACLQSQEDDVCILNGHPVVSQTWKWLDGTRIKVRLQAAKDPVELDVSYTREADQVAGDAL